jgi:hypothetical protein
LDHKRIPLTHIAIHHIPPPRKLLVAQLVDDGPGQANSDRPDLADRKHHSIARKFLVVNRQR